MSNSTLSSSSSASASSLSSSIASEISSSVLSSTPSSSTPSATSSAPGSTSTYSLSSIPPSTQIVVSTVTQSPKSAGDTTPGPIIVTATITRSGSTTPVTKSANTGNAADQTSSSAAALNTGGSSSNKGSGGGLSTAGVTAVAVVVPVVVVALLVLAGIFLWRKRKQKKAAEEARRKEVEDYGFNPNNDPTLPTVASENGAEMTEDHSSGYRGWGAAAGSNRKMSTTLSGGHTQGQLSDTGSNAYRGAGSPTGGNSDGNSDNPLVNRRETMNSDDLGALGSAPIAAAMMQPGMKRGPSNASSTYTAAAHSDVSEEPPLPNGGMSHSYEAYNPATGYGYSQHGPYGDGTYGGAQDGGMPVVRDVSARRNTRIQQAGNFQQGNSGISQNF